MLAGAETAEHRGLGYRPVPLPQQYIVSQPISRVLLDGEGVGVAVAVSSRPAGGGGQLHREEVQPELADKVRKRGEGVRTRGRRAGRARVSQARRECYGSG